MSNGHFARFIGWMQSYYEYVVSIDVVWRKASFWWLTLPTQITCDNNTGTHLACAIVCRYQLGLSQVVWFVRSCCGGQALLYEAATNEASAPCQRRRSRRYRMKAFSAFPEKLFLLRYIKRLSNISLIEKQSQLFQAQSWESNESHIKNHFWVFKLKNCSCVEIRQDSSSPSAVNGHITQNVYQVSGIASINLSVQNDIESKLLAIFRHSYQFETTISAHLWHLRTKTTWFRDFPSTSRCLPSIVRSAFVL